MSFENEYHGKQVLWYDPKEDRLLVTDKHKHVYFAENLFWKMFSLRGDNPRQVTTRAELHEVMHQAGYEFIGELNG